ncbi:hypothetical protein LWI28_009928 [Acer negundo]|uniref:Uncharacterized protein n=1 Tax=Acer negundo TaxID=4023 RepID=A0AAD5NZE1_ACENE|nr:hypothetical protein LWI28_009928 [Acer negundo]
MVHISDPKIQRVQTRRVGVGVLARIALLEQVPPIVLPNGSAGTETGLLSRKPLELYDAAGLLELKCFMYYRVSMPSTKVTFKATSASPLRSDIVELRGSDLIDDTQIST